MPASLECLTEMTRAALRETIDGDLMADGNLRSQAGQPERTERAVPEGDDVGPDGPRLQSGFERSMPLGLIRGETGSRKIKREANETDPRFSSNQNGGS
jgi:hypothetical protein